MAHGNDGRNLDPGIRLVLEEIRDLRVEFRADRRQAAEDRRQAADDRRQAAEDRRRSDERFELVIAEFRRDSARREAATRKILETTQKAFKDIRTVGLAIVKTLNRHTRLLERMDRKLGIRRHGGPGQANGRTT